MVRLLLTSDWRLGRTFKRFSAEAQARLAHARLKSLEWVLAEAERNKVEALVCAGDLFDSPNPTPELRRAVVSLLSGSKRRVVVVPGDRDALTAGSVWRVLAAELPEQVTVVLEDGLELPLSDGSTLVAAACLQPVEATEAVERLAGGKGRRIGVAHVSPRASTPPRRDDFTALLLGGSELFRFADDDKRAVFAGTHEPMDFGQLDAGRVALVTVNDAGAVVVEPKKVSGLQWDVVRIDSLAALRRVAGRTDLDSAVLRLEVQASVPLGDVVDFERELRALGDREDLVLELDTSGFKLDLKDRLAVADWPEPLQHAAQTLLEKSQHPVEGPVAMRAMAQLAELLA